MRGQKPNPYYVGNLRAGPRARACVCVCVCVCGVCRRVGTLNPRAVKSARPHYALYSAPSYGTTDGSRADAGGGFSKRVILPRVSPGFPQGPALASSTGTAGQRGPRHSKNLPISPNTLARIGAHAARTHTLPAPVHGSAGWSGGYWYCKK